ncbi:MAG: CotH kinase family protein [Bacteroidales bacterium]|nr:CotH kinase family protein [Bacteroidales bacterium]
MASGGETIKKRSQIIRNPLPLLLFLFIFNSSYPQADFSYQSQFSYLKGKDAALLSQNWTSPSFDDSGWAKGFAPFRYGDGAFGTELTDMMNSYSTVFLRSNFECASSSKITTLTLLADYDDGFIVWINGTRALTVNAPAVPAYNSFASANHESGAGERFEIDAAAVGLHDGINTIAVQCFNVSLSSTDFYLDIDIRGEVSQTETSYGSGVTFSVPSGFYTAAFPLELSSLNNSYEIIYTLDGSNPQDSPSAVRSSSPMILTVDPDSEQGRPATPAFIVRASVVSADFKPSKPEARTYIFTEKVKTQSWPGGDWPNTNINGQLIDLDVDRRIVTDPAYVSQFDASLKYIPTISIVTDIKNLFDPARGIYVNAKGHGTNWERECSAELINPDMSEGFSINAGLRIRGGYSRNDGFPKHAFRLFFREEYGAAKLKFPLFGDEGVDEFDKIDFRCEENYAWNNGDSRNSFVREVFSRDTQRDMGRPYTRSRYYHLYLNGMYWGLYMSQERAEARFAESYFGDDSEDYDVVKVDVEAGYQVEATDGNLDSWQKLLDMCSDGFSTEASYNALEGRDANGNPYRGGEILVDIDNLIDFMLVIFYTGNIDSPTAVFMSNKKANNFYAIDNRNDRSKGFIFFTHDAEHSLFSDANSPGIGLSENRVNIASRTDNLKMEVSGISSFHPQWLHYKLTSNKEYVSRFQNRAYNHFRPGGVFTEEKARERISKRVNEVDLAIISESARWGDAKRPGAAPYTRNGNWFGEINKIRDVYVRYRPEIVIGQLRAEGLYPGLDAPVIAVDGVTVNNDDINIGTSAGVAISNPNSAGSVYYTVDGSDPRSSGGTLNPSAIFVNSSAKINFRGPAVIRARVLEKGSWSAISEARLYTGNANYSGLKITEIQYHPEDYIQGSDTIKGKDLEFLEFKNTGTDAVDLSGLKIDSAVTYTFPLSYLLPPGAFFVAASKPSRFFDYYGMKASGNFRGNLANEGEEILVSGMDNREVIRLTYGITAPWPSEADGEGNSLASAENDPGGDPSDYTYWVSSFAKGGNPFSDNILGDDNELEENELDVSLYPNPTTGIIRVEINSFEPDRTYEMILSDMSGRITGRIETGRESVIDLRRFKASQGVYILTVRSGKQSRKLKVVVIR